MLKTFGILEIELDDSANIVFALINRKFDSLSLFVFVLEYFRFLSFVEDDFNIDGSAKSSEEVGYFILS
jgi:hypothetical protein